MCNDLRCALIALFGVALSAASAWGQSSANAPGTLTSRERFSSSVRVVQKGQGESAALDYRVWSLAPGMRLATLPLKSKGYLVVELQTGKLTTVIDGKKEERQEGEFWVVQPGETMALFAADDTVVIRTILLPIR